MTDGYIYCLSNTSMPGILKVGMTERSPDIRLKEANSSDTWRPPTPYKIEFAKKVSNPIGKEKTLHALLELYTHRINPRREFFTVSPEEVCKFFDLIDGEVWTENKEIYYDDEHDEDNPDIRTITKPYVVRGCRDMTKCFIDKQRIRHTIGTKTWIGIYDYSKHAIIHDEILYSSLTKFATAHALKDYNPTRTSERDGWKHCECEIEGKWVSTYCLPF
jgi:hypothetical protein